MSKIQWTEKTWNPVVGCTPVSPGCLNCYAATMAPRLAAMGQKAYVGLTVKRKGSCVAAGPVDETPPLQVGKVSRNVFNGTVRCLPERLSIPLHWRKAKMVFVNSMSDLFHESVPFEFIDRAFAVMALCPQHTFQILTKRPERMAEYLMSRDREEGEHREQVWNAKVRLQGKPVSPMVWPLPNVWLGTSVEDQKRADERIPWLLKCPAAVRFLSCEPLLGEIDLDRWLWKRCGAGCSTAGYDSAPGFPGGHRCNTCNSPGYVASRENHWVIAGGESGPQSRACDIAWIRSIVKQCTDARVPVFVKQLGAMVSGQIDHPDNEGYGVSGVRLEDRKGGDMAEWPEDLRVREFPVSEGIAAASPRPTPSEEAPAPRKLSRGVGPECRVASHQPLATVAHPAGMPEVKA